MMTEANAGTQLYVLGRLFRVLMDTARERGASSSELENATHNPMAGIGYAYNLIIKSHRLTPETEKKIAALLEQVDPKDVTFDQSPSLEMQSNFMAGYQMGGQGLLAKSPIAEHRKGLGITQTQLAKAVGVSQKDISRWENGVIKPSVAKLKLLAEALECKMEDLI